MATITYKDLSPALKTLVVFGWIIFGIYAISFWAGFFSAIFG